MNKLKTPVRPLLGAINLYTCQTAHRGRSVTVYKVGFANNWAYFDCFDTAGLYAIRLSRALDIEIHQAHIDEKEWSFTWTGCMANAQREHYFEQQFKATVHEWQKLLVDRSNNLWKLQA